MPERYERIRRRPRIAALVLLAVLAAQAGAQEADETGAVRTGREEVFAPFVSRLRLSIRDPQVRVTWQDAADIEATYRVYRSTSPITNETLDQAELIARIAPDEEAFIDRPPEPGDYYYAVIAESASGTPYRVVIPGRNASLTPVGIASIATESERAAEVVSINADVVLAEGRRAIEITAVSDREGRTLAVYRSTEPITDAEDLPRASLVREVASGEVRIVDLPVPGVPYYYAAVDAELLIADTVTVTPGRNATGEPTEIPIQIASTDETPDADVAPGAQTGTSAEPIFEPSVTEARGVPLPFLRLQSQLATGLRLGDPRILIPDRSEIGEETTNAVASLIAELGARSNGSVTPVILVEDRMPEPEGAEYTLRTIIDGPFARMAWESTLEQLNNYFTLPLTPALEARAHFYRAQAYYFTGERQRAILELLLARDHHYVEAEAWLTRILTAGT